MSSSMATAYGNLRDAEARWAEADRDRLKAKDDLHKVTYNEAKRCGFIGGISGKWIEKTDDGYLIISVRYLEGEVQPRFTYEFIQEKS